MYSVLGKLRKGKKSICRPTMSFTLCLSLDSVILRGTVFFDFLALSLRSVASGWPLFLITSLDWMLDTFLDPTGRPMAALSNCRSLIMRVNVSGLDGACFTSRNLELEKGILVRVG